jgi:NADH:ubiquinone oxidoreductase subunit H
VGRCGALAPALVCTYHRTRFDRFARIAWRFFSPGSLESVLGVILGLCGL